MTKILEPNIVYKYNIDLLDQYKLKITSSGIYYLTYYYDNNPDKDVFIDIEKNLNVVLVENHEIAKGSEQYASIKVNLNVKSSSTVKIRSYLSNTKLTLNYKSNIDLYKDTNLKTYYGFFGSHSTSNHEIKLLEKGASVNSNIRALIDLDYVHNHNVLISHLASHTFSDIVNYVVADDEGIINLEANSYIKKGCFKSEAYQTSRVYALSDDIKSNLNPILNIKENDVKASHAATLGKLNYLDLHYIMSRGLSQKEANHLITLGLLLKDIDIELQDELSFIIERRLKNV